MQGPIISVMLAVEDTPSAVEWYKRALDAKVLWSLGPVAGLEIAGAPFFLGEPANNGWESPEKLGSRLRGLKCSVMILMHSSRGP